MRGYRPQLDSLRALAVAAVLYCHFWSPATELADLGVRLFFVLSGFLLTGILIRESDQARLSEIPRPRVLFDFYVRRILRIWPAYYFVLIAAVVLGAASVATTFAWHAFFATNFLLLRDQEWNPIYGHLWTLSIEEQFYLVLPLVVLFAPRKRLGPIFIGCIFLAVVFRGLVCLIVGSGQIYIVVPFAQLDALGAGALLAWLQHRGAMIPWLKLMAWSLPAALLMDAFGTYSAVHLTFVAAAYVLPMVALVAAADAGVAGRAGRLLSSRALVALGRISYGIYLYHLFVAAGVDALMKRSGYAPFAVGPERFLALTLLTILTATASWFLIERPALSLKRFFRRAEREAIVPASPTLAVHG